MNILGIIPARYASTRFPGKPLVDINGQSMVERVYKQVKKALDFVVIATDDERIFNAVEAFGGVAVMTSELHQSGTDRCAEAAALFIQNNSQTIDVVLNIQGDEPLIDPKQIKQLANLFVNDSTEIGTLVKPIVDNDTLFDENKVKVILNESKEAIYFSRHTIPFVKGVAKNEWLNYHAFFQHIGLYGYRLDILNQLVELPQSNLEKMESLEQLRWVEKGYSIMTAVSNISALPVDTPEDLEKVLDYLKNN
jgi:3-deoxy-manno-octulosonate cytidylyltransferase (CMP-KDO synthetase)